jgi:hypothetical protein
MQSCGRAFLLTAALHGVRDRPGEDVCQQVPRQERNDQDWMDLSKSLLIVSACMVGIPCGNPAYVFSVPFCTSSTARGPEVA